MPIKWEEVGNVDDLVDNNPTNKEIKWEEVGTTEDLDAEIESGKMGYGESALTGFGEGASLGLAPQAAGWMGVGLEGTGLGDKIGGEYEGEGKFKGMTPNEVDDELRAQGFDVEEKGDFDRLMEAFYSSKDAQIAQQEKSFEDNPLTTLGGNLAGGIATMSGGAGVLGAGAKAEKLTKLGQLANKAAQSKALAPLAKLAPSTASLKGASNKAKLGNLMLEGAKAGGIAAVGSGKERLYDEDKSLLESGMDVAKETGIGALAGGGAAGLLGIGTKLAGATASKTWGGLKGLANTKIGKNLVVPFKAAVRGLDMSDDAAIRKYSDEVTNGITDVINDNFKGNNKKMLMENADEIGIKVKAGKAIQDVIDQLLETSSDKMNQRARKKLANTWQYRIKKINKNADDIVKLDDAVAKKRLAQEAKGNTLVQNKTGSDRVDELVPQSESNTTLLSNEDTFLLDNAGKEKKILSTRAVGGDEAAPIYQVDPNELSFKETKRMQNEAYTTAQKFGADTQADAELKGIFNNLYAELKKEMNNSVEGTSLQKENSKLNNLYDALRMVDIDPKDFFSADPKTKSNVMKKLRGAVNAKSNSDTGFDFTDFLEHLGMVDKAGADAIKKESKFARDVALVSGDDEGWIGTTLLKKGLRSVGDAAGSVVGSVYNTTSHLDKRKALIAASNESLDKTSQKLLDKFGEKAAGFARVLKKAAESKPGVKRNAVMYGLASNPAFMKMVDDATKEEESNDE